MRMITAVGVVLCLAAAGVQAQQQIQVFVAVDSPGGPPPAVGPTDLRVTEGGLDLKITKVEPVTGWPTKLQILLDNGIGLGGENLIHLRNGLRGLLEALPAGVEVSVVTTAPQPCMLVRPTSDKAAMLKGIDLLAPDSGSGRFVDSLSEALQRTERDKTNHFPMIVMVGSSAGDNNVMERDIERIQQRIIAKPSTIHVVILSSPQRNASGGAVQSEVGIGVTKMTGGRFESIAAPSRLATLMPELGQQVAASHQKQSSQFRITADRPNPSAPIAGVSVAASALKVTGVSFDGRHP
jgi:hypothetical protein